jgi:hypothetical protein
MTWRFWIRALDAVVYLGGYQTRLYFWVLDRASCAYWRACI